jgi:hypothetical protein
MAEQLFVLKEVLAMMQVVDISPAKIAALKRQAEAVAEKRPTKGYDDVTVSSGYGSSSKQGFVELTINDQRTQMEIKKAIEIAVMMIEAASAAATDAAIMQLMRERVGIDDEERLARILLDVREMRQGTRGIAKPS